MKKVKTDSLAAQLIKIQLITTSFVLGLCFCAFLVKDFMATKSFISSRMESLTNILSRNLTVALDFDDREEAKRILAALDSEKEITSITVFDSAGKVFASKGILQPEELNSLPLKQSNQSQQIVFKGLKGAARASITEKGKRLGSVLIVVDLKFYQKFILLSIFVIFGITLLVVPLSFWLAKQKRKKITVPISAILDVIAEVRRNANYSRRIDRVGEQGIEELATLETSFNELLEVVDSRDKKIKSINENLEQLVENKSKELEEQRAQTIQSGKLAALGEMAAGIAHEINNPLTIISCNATLIRKEAEKEEVRKEILVKNSLSIEKVVTRISKIVTGLRNVSRDGSQDPVVKCELKDLVDDTLVFCKKRFENMRIDLDISLPEEPLFLHCRPVQISQVILNLLNNAFDAVEELDAKWVRLEAKEEAGFVELRITDSGRGISEEIAQKILHPFFTTKPVGKGTGLGLSVSRGIIQSHKGSIEVDSGAKNTSFLIKLPVGDEESSGSEDLSAA